MTATLTAALTGEEITILKSYKRSRFSLVQHKAEALLLLEDGIILDIIARFVERQPSTITTWITGLQPTTYRQPVYRPRSQHQRLQIHPNTT